ncbi:MAG: cytoplasmic protein [Anaerolineae bacterium]|jgi:predicted peroxiredoxin
MQEKIALVLMAGTDMPCRMTHTLLWALDIAARGGDAKIILEGEAPHWLLELPDPKHGRHQLYRKVTDVGLIDAVCKACAVQAQAVEAAAEEGLRLVFDASGHVSLMPYIGDGYRIVTL